MNGTEILRQHYEAYDEEGRLLSKHGQVEYITTQKYIHACADAIGAKRILEIGAWFGNTTFSKKWIDKPPTEIFDRQANYRLCRFRIRQ